MKISFDRKITAHYEDKKPSKLKNCSVVELSSLCNGPPDPSSRRGLGRLGIECCLHKINNMYPSSVLGPHLFWY